MTNMTPTDDKRLDGQVAIVTGASSGLGRAVALAVAQAGAEVALVARSRPDLEAVAQQIEDYAQRTLVLPVDLAAGEQIQAGVEQVIGTLGRIDLLVNAAGTDVPGPIEELAIEGWDRVLDVNLRAPFLLAKAVFPHMRQHGGTIINISSVAGKRGWANAAAYVSAKFGLTGLTQVLNAEGKPYGIRATVLYPGAMATNWGAWTPQTRHERAEDVPEVLPPAEALPASEVAKLILWIATAPAEVVLNEAIVTPRQESAWP